MSGSTTQPQRDDAWLIEAAREISAQAYDASVCAGVLGMRARTIGEAIPTHEAYGLIRLIRRCGAERPRMAAEMPRVPVGPRHPPRYVAAAIRYECQAVLDTAAVEAPDRLYRATRALGRFVAGGEARREPVERALLAAARAVGISEAYAREIIGDAWDLRRMAA